MINAEPDLFTFIPEKGKVYLNDSIQADFLKGLLCPDTDEVTLTFYLISNLLGNSTETLSIPVKRPEQEKDDATDNVSKFKGVVISEHENSKKKD